MERSTHPFQKLWSHASSHRGRVLVATAYSVLNKLFDLAPPILIGAAVDVVVEREDSLIAGFGFPDPTDQLLVLAVVTVVIWSFESLFEYLQAIAWRNLAQTIQHELRVDAYAHVQSLDLAYFHDTSTGGLMSVLNDDINQLERFLDHGADNVVQITTTAIAVSITFFALAPGVAWMAMLPIPLILFGSFRYQRLLAPRYEAVREHVGVLNGRLANNLRGIQTIKSFATEGYETSRVQIDSQSYREANARAIALSSAFSPIIRFAIVSGFTATLIYGGHLALEGELAVGTYSVLVFLTQRLLWPLTRLGQTFDQYQRAAASTARVMGLLETEPSIVDGPETPDAMKGKIAFQNVDFSYDGRDPILVNFDLAIEPGQTVGIVGATGSGKTTLINLILRFYEPNNGTVSIDDVTLPEWELSNLRRGVGLVSQRPFLFHGTVAENISYGTPDASDEAIEDAARAAEVMEFVESLPNGMQTIIGERGETLSGGQAQRISIARAVLKNPKILILDEATSAVDNETEAAIQRSMELITQNRTTLVIAHRLSTVRKADRIIVLENGGIVESGSHDELTAADGRYAYLWRVQTGDLA